MNKYIFYILIISPNFLHGMGMNLEDQLRENLFLQGDAQETISSIRSAIKEEREMLTRTMHQRDLSAELRYLRDLKREEKRIREKIKLESDT